MTFRRWTSALLACPAELLLSVVAAAAVGLFVQRADASRTPIDTNPAALAPDANGWYRHLTVPCRGAVEYETEQTAANAAGRVTTRTVAGRDYTYSYDAYGRLLSYTDSTDSGNNASYTYDAFGNRVGMTVGSTHRRMVYENEDVIAEYVDLGNDGSVNRSRLYWILPDIDQRIGFVEMEGGATNLYFYLTDHIGSVLQIVDESGAVVNQYDYDAFGNIRWENSFEGVENRYTFQGREWDAHAGHYYFRNRTYVPEWGGFSGPDMNLALGVAGEPNGLMSYLAFDNDPAGKVDPLGLSPGPIISVTMDLETGEMRAGYIGQDIDWSDWGRVSTYDPEQFWSDCKLAGTVSAAAGEIAVGTIWAPASWALDAKDLGLGVNDFRKGHRISGCIQVGASVIGFVPAGDILKKPVVGIARRAKRLTCSGDLAKVSEVGATVADSSVTRPQRWMQLAEEGNPNLTKQEIDFILRHNGEGVYSVFGKELAHPPKRATAQGFDYSETLPKYKADHRGIQHRYLVERRAGTTLNLDPRPRTGSVLDLPPEGALPK